MQKKKDKRNILIAIMSALLCATIISGMIINFISSSQTEESEESITKPIYADGFSFMYPKSWTINESSKNSSTLVFENINDLSGATVTITAIKYAAKRALKNSQDDIDSTLFAGLTNNSDYTSQYTCSVQIVNQSDSKMGDFQGYTIEKMLKYKSKSNGTENSSTFYVKSFYINNDIVFLCLKEGSSGSIALKKTLDKMGDTFEKSTVYQDEKATSAANQNQSSSESKS